jgi:hypothetical protein
MTLMVGNCLFSRVSVDLNLNFKQHQLLKFRTRRTAQETVLMLLVQRESKKNAMIFTYRHNDFGHFQPNQRQLVPFAPAPSAQVHAEFYRRYQALRTFPNELDQAMPQQHAGANEVVFIGYGLGGCLASYAALEYRLKHPKHSVIRLSTYNAPRCGNAAFVTLIEAQISYYRRWVQGGASMTAYPDPKEGYRHMGHEMWWTSDQTVCCDASEHSECSSQRPISSLNSEENGNMERSAIFGPAFMQRVHHVVSTLDPTVNSVLARTSRRY